MSSPPANSLSHAAPALDAEWEACFESEMAALSPIQRDLVEMGYDWVWQTDEHHCFRYLSQNFEELTGRSRGLFLGRSRVALVQEAAADPTLLSSSDLARHLADLEARRPFRNFVYGRRMSAGDTQYVAVSGRPWFGADGAFRGYRGVSLDVTDLIETRRRLEQAEADLRRANASLEARVALRTRELEGARRQAMAADQVKSAFLANISHELRTPLNAILGFSDVLEGQSLGPIGDENLRCVRGVKEAGVDLLRMVVDIIDLSKIAAGAMALMEEPVPLGEVVSDAVGRVSARASRQGVTLQAEGAVAAAPEVCVDEGKIKQAFLGLLVRAIEATPNGGVVRVCVATANARGVALEIEGEILGDTADASPPRAGESPRGGPRGGPLTASLAPSLAPGVVSDDGLGVLLARRIVELHGGSVETYGPSARLLLPLSRLVDADAFSSIA